MSRRRGAGSIYRHKGSKTWTIAFYLNGRKQREYTGETDYQVARQRLNQRLAAVAKGEFVAVKTDRITVENLAQDLFRDLRINRRASLGDAERRWKKHLQPFFGMHRASAVTSSAIAEYVDQRLKEEAQPATINREVAALRRMFRLGYHATPPKVVRLPRFPRLQENNVRTGFVESKDYESLKAHARELWLRAILELAATYGWRRSELVNLKVNQIDLVSRTIRLNPGETKNGQGRGNHDPSGLPPARRMRS